MWEILWAVLTIFTPSDADVEALRSSAPSYLTTETARENLVAARLASYTHGVDPNLVLSLAYFESRYTANVVSKEPQGKISCGVMTPVPTHDKKWCMQATASLAAGYDVGAAHLREWFDACRGNKNCALLGYAGGYKLINACKEGPVIRDQKNGTTRDLCDVPKIRQWRANHLAPKAQPKSHNKRAKAPQS